MLCCGQGYSAKTVVDAEAGGSLRIDRYRRCMSKFPGWQISSLCSHDTVAASAQIGLRILNETGTPETRQVLVKFVDIFPKVVSYNVIICHVNFLKTDPNLWFAGSSSLTHKRTTAWNCQSGCCGQLLPSALSDS